MCGKYFDLVGLRLFRDNRDDVILHVPGYVNPSTESLQDEVCHIIGQCGDQLPRNDIAMLLIWLHPRSPVSFLALTYSQQCAFYSTKSGMWGPRNGYYAFEDGPYATGLAICFHYAGVEKNYQRTLFECIDPRGDSLLMRSVGTFAADSQDKAVIACEEVTFQDQRSWHIVIQKVPNDWFCM